MAEQPIPQTMIEAVARFSDPKVAHDFFVKIRFPYGVACPRMGCGSARVAFLEKRMVWYCNDCKRQFSAKVGTVFEDSPIPFTKWLPAIWLLASNRNGVSSCELARALRVQQKTAWFMLHRIREMMRDDDATPLRGHVEVDETYVGGKKKRSTPLAKRIGRRNKGVGKGPFEGKTPVMGMVERGGRVRAFVVPSNRRRTLMPLIEEHVEKGSTIYTDSLRSYQPHDEEYVHHVINHAIEYVRGHVHTNSIEAFWSVLKRALKGTYVAPRPEYLQRYVEEEVFRFNERENKDGPRFTKALKGADGKRLTHKALTAKREG